ncbi:CCA tRNA nucleotidyltransferase, mitochondrial, partial [Coemansia sp. RSA 2703]
ALDAKISRERVGAEVALMASGPRPLMAVRLLIAHALYPVVFRSPAALDSSSVLPVHVAEQLTHEVLAMLDTPELVDRLPMHIFSADSTETRRLLVLAAYLHPYHASLVTDGKRQVPAALVVMRDALKMSNHDTDTVVALHALASHVASTAASLLDSPTEVSRSHLGLEIRRAARLWPLAVVYAAALDSMNTSDAAAGKDKVVAKYVAYAEHVESRGLVQAYEVKHLVDGKRAASILGVRPGPVIKRVLEQVMVWQLDHPEGSREQCEAFVRDAGLPSDTA